MPVQSLDQLIESIYDANKDLVELALAGPPPQRLLKLKLLIQHIDSREDKTQMPLFTEEIVNRLMLMSFLLGTEEGRVDGYREGYAACKLEMMYFLEN